jgi:hypothetical protein
MLCGPMTSMVEGKSSTCAVLMTSSRGGEKPSGQILGLIVMSH